MRNSNLNCFKAWGGGKNGLVRKHNIVDIATYAIVFSLACWLLASTARGQSQPGPKPSASPSPAVAAYQQISLKGMTVDEATKLYLKMLMQDQYYDWKVLLNFYGRVVDYQTHQPIAGVKVSYEWNTVDAPSGTADANAVSDENGLFSLIGKRGRFLGVRVEKEGYYTVEGGNGDINFEYADPSSPYYYEPDKSNPIVFHLRKKGAGANIHIKTLNLGLHQHQLDAHVNLGQGFINPNGMFGIKVDASKFLPGAQPFPWTASLTMSEGGLVETDEQFPFNAPATGYKAAIPMVDMQKLERGVWSGYIVKTYYFYLSSTNTYGRVTVTAAVALPVTLDIFYNPTPGDRYLEPASSEWIGQVLLKVPDVDRTNTR